MGLKGIFTCRGHGIPRIGFVVDKRFLHFDKMFLFQFFYVGGKVPVGHIQKFFEGCEVKAIVYRKSRHDAQPDPAFKCFM